MDFRRAVLIGFLGLAAGGVAAACMKNNQPPTFERLADSFEEQVDELDREWDGIRRDAAERIERDPQIGAFANQIERGLSELERHIERLDDASEDERETIERQIESTISELERSLDEVRRDLG